MARSTFPSQNVMKKHHMSGPLLEVEMLKNYAPLWRKDAPSTCPNQMSKSTTCSDHFLKLRCRNSARHCGAKHVPKSNAQKHHMSGRLFEVEMLKKCTPLRREARVQVKSIKNLFWFRALLTFKCRFSWQAQDILHLVGSEQNVRVLWW